MLLEIPVVSVQSAEQAPVVALVPAVVALVPAVVEQGHPVEQQANLVEQELVVAAGIVQRA